MRRVLWVVAFCGLLGGLSAAPAPALPTQVLLPSLRDGNYDLILMNLDGSEAKNLTRSKASQGVAKKDLVVTNLYPAWSPDAKKIAFASDREGGLAIFVMDANGANVKQLTNKAHDRGPAWSPDGKKIAFCRHVDGNPEIFVMDADGSHAVNLTNDAAFDADPTWSPDGKQIAFASDRGGKGFRVYVMDADGKNVKDVSGNSNRLGYVYPAWSPNGKKIAYSDQVEDDLEIFTCDPDGDNIRQVTKLNGRNTYAAWSPDSKKLVFQHYDGASAGPVYVMDANGENMKVLSKKEGPVEGGRPAWKPR